MADWVQDIVAGEETTPSGWRQRLKAMFAAQNGTFFLWSPLCLIAGIWIYFGLPREPPSAAFAIILLILVLLFWSMRISRSLIARILILILIGFCLAKARSEWVEASVIRAPTGEAMIEGAVEDFEARGAKRAVIILRVTTLAGKGVTNMPARARLTVTNALRLAPGEIVRAKTQLFPLPSPAVAGGYDFGRNLWFEGIGATGRLYGEIEVTGTDDSWLLRFKADLADLRQAIGLRIRAVIPEQRSGVGEAMITGERGGIRHDVNDSLQTSGLAHILSISGLHMSLVAGGVFALVRALLAFSTALALSYPIKKWAALAGLVVGFAYMLLAGASVATERSYIMLAVMFIAILADRPALSMRNLAIAALIILALFPEAALTASFQMSFLAVMGLLAFHEVWSRWLAGREGHSRGLIYRWTRFAFLAFCAAALTSLAAGGFSSIAAAYHFGRVSPYSLIANLLALPVISAVVMPMAVLSVLAMPFGLEAWPLVVMDQGLASISYISDWVGSLPQARGLVPALPLASALLVASAALILCLTRGVLRLLALPFIAAAVMSAMLVERPDILIERSGKNVAIRNDNGELVPAHPRRGSFAASQWLRMDGDGATLRDASLRPGWSCEALICRAVVKKRRIVYVSNEVPVMSLPCAEADILIASFPLRGRCRSVPLRIDRFTVWRAGAHSLFIDADGVRVETAQALQGERPWRVVPAPRRKDTSRSSVK